MEAKIVILTKAETKKALEDAKCPPDIVNRIGADLHLWWKAGWIQEILLTQKQAGIEEGRREVVEWVEKNSHANADYNSEGYKRSSWLEIYQGCWQAYKKKLGYNV